MVKAGLFGPPLRGERNALGLDEAQGRSSNQPWASGLSSIQMDAGSDFPPVVERVDRAQLGTGGEVAFKRRLRIPAHVSPPWSLRGLSLPEMATACTEVIHGGYDRACKREYLENAGPARSLWPVCEYRLERSFPYRRPDEADVCMP